MSHLPDSYLRSLVSPEVQVGNVVKELAQALLDQRDKYMKLLDVYDQAQIEIASLEEALENNLAEIYRLRQVVVLCPRHHEEEMNK